MKTWLRTHWAMLAALACVAVLFGVRSNLSCVRLCAAAKEPPSGIQI